MLVASDTSPISNLAIIGRLDLLRDQFQEIWIPAAVMSELRNLPDAAAAERIRLALAASWLKPRQVRQERIVRFLEATLHSGEAEAIALGLELPADLVLIDERDGRNAARRMGLRVTGVLGVLMRGKNDGQISNLKPEITALRTNAGFYVSSHLEAQVLTAVGQ